MPFLIKHQNDIASNRSDITNKGLTIGRSAKNAFLIDDPSVSQFHAIIDTRELKDGSLIYFIQDLESTNQTLVNNQAITQHLLCDQDIISIGLHEFKYIDENTESLAATKAFKKSWIPGIMILKD